MIASKKMTAMLTRNTPIKIVDGKWQYEVSVIEVEVMAVAKGYVMVRRKGCVPFVAKDKDLDIFPKAKP